MSVEKANFVTELDKRFPRKEDFRSSWAEHIRLIKAALKSSFPEDLAGLGTPSKWSSLEKTATGVRLSQYPMVIGELNGDQTVSSGGPTHLTFNFSTDPLGIGDANGKDINVPRSSEVYDATFLLSVAGGLSRGSVFVEVFFSSGSTFAMPEKPVGGWMRDQVAILLTRFGLDFGNTSPVRVAVQGDDGFTLNGSKTRFVLIPRGATI